MPYTLKTTIGTGNNAVYTFDVDKTVVNTVEETYTLAELNQKENTTTNQIADLEDRLEKKRALLTKIQALKALI